MPLSSNQIFWIRYIFYPVTLCCVPSCLAFSTLEKLWSMIIIFNVFDTLQYICVLSLCFLALHWKCADQDDFLHRGWQDIEIPGGCYRFTATSICHQCIPCINCCCCYDWNYILNEGSDLKKKKNKAITGDKFTNMVIPKLLLRFHLNSRSAQLEPLPCLDMAENKKNSYIIEYLHFFDLG